MERKDLEKKAKKTYSEYVKILAKAFKVAGVKENEYLKAIKLSDRDLCKWMYQKCEATVALKKGLKRSYN